MKSLWNDDEARALGGDTLSLRVYTSRLLGQESELVLHGGGNTSLKAADTNVFGEAEAHLYIKGSGWDLATIEAAGFPAVRQDVLKRLPTVKGLGDPEAMTAIRAAMIDPTAPTPSVEAILHAIIPFDYVDHTHADAVLTLTNTESGEERIREIYRDRVLIVPYVMPGIALAKTVHEMTAEVDWDKLDGIIVLNHGIFTFGGDARSAYERMIAIVTMAEEYADKNAGRERPAKTSAKEDLLELARIRRAVSGARGGAMIAALDTGPEPLAFSTIPNVGAIAEHGPLTPDHVIRTKRTPVVIDGSPEDCVTRYARSYRDYFERNKTADLECVDPAPRWGIWPGHGTVSFGDSAGDASIVNDITSHTITAIRRAEALGGWKALPEADIFRVEYWEPERAKLARTGEPPVFQGKVALVTGAASGIGRACVDMLRRFGAAVGALDIRDGTVDLFDGADVAGLQCDVTDPDNVKASVDEVIRRFGGLDILVSNAGLFPESARIIDTDPDTWSRSLAVNLTSHQVVLQACIPYLELGIDPAVVIIASKNVPAPGPGASAYSVAKAGLTQLGRVAALELGPAGIRVNMIHPHAVFDTSLWTDEVLEKRAKHYRLTVEQYRTNNLLKVEITSENVAALACAMAGPPFARTTGSQVPIDGGSDRTV